MLKSDHNYYKIPENEASTPLQSVNIRSKRELTCVDLFAGCGGLSLGLEQAGFKPLLFSELNQSAAETYMVNRAGQYIIPYGDIRTLTNEVLDVFKLKWRIDGIHEIDLVCGGPPCQGYSGIGHRRTFKDLQKRDVPSNHLYQEMVRVIGRLRPKAFLFENVRGLLTSRWSANGVKGEVFRDILREFRTLRDYVVRWDLVQAKDYGVPQNRPRILMVGIRSDILYPAQQLTICENSEAYLEEPSAIREGFLPKPIGGAPNLEDLLSDLVDPEYLSKRSTNSYILPPLSIVQEQLRTRPDGVILSIGDSLTDHEYSQHSEYIREKFEYMIQNGGSIPLKFQTKKFAQRVLPKRWKKDGPNITACSLPEDYVHFAQPRGLTVREWARLQTFPDWYLFCGPRTTGGRRRAGDPDAGIWNRDVPKYTQIGNAVPVQLARAIGNHLATIL